jgi:hypothetical protein
MTLKEGEIGKILRVSTMSTDLATGLLIPGTGFDLSGNSELTLKFTILVTDTIVEKVKADGVSAPAVDIDDPDLGPLLADQYYEYPIESGFLAVGTAGPWVVNGIYDDATPKRFCGDAAQFSVLPC